MHAARLYVITPETSPERVLDVAAAAIRGGAEIVQLRHKSMPRGELLTLARELRQALPGVLFIVNDYVDIALLSGADGVHLGPDDMTVDAARKVAGERLLIGVSASTPDAVQNGADYVGCGPAFSTPVKPEKKVVGPAGIAAMQAALKIPVFGIGGIDASNLDQLVGVGVRRACVIRAVGDAPDPEQAARELRAMLAQGDDE
ncbi:MAG TPA: thiamine phosphate synthase [Candidatus Dormibacteraeota bacterium]